MSTSLEHAAAGINVCSDRYFIAQTTGICPDCGLSTPLLAVVLPPGHEMLDDQDDQDDETLGDNALGDNAAEDGALPDAPFGGQVPLGHARDSGIPTDTWSIATEPAVLFYIEYLPDSVQHCLIALSPVYRIGGGDGGGGDAAPAPYWANHCGHCGALQDDHELFCEPGGAFLPLTAAAVASIHLLSIDEPIEAAAAGYAYQPQFIESSSRT